MTIHESSHTLTSEAPTERPHVQAAAVAPTAVVATRRPFRYTLERYHAAIAAGILTENDKVELINGELIEKMSIGKKHNDCVQHLNLYFVIRYGQTHGCRPQCSVTLSLDSEPEPDFAIINRETYATRTGNPEPADILLIVEVADTSLEYDREDKARMYAAAGLPEYWIVNLQHDQVELHTLPNVATGMYDSIQRFGRGKTFESPFCGAVVMEEVLGGIV